MASSTEAFMADAVTRAEFDALVKRVTALDGGGTAPDPQPAPGLPVKVTPQAGAVKVEWTPVAGRAVKAVTVGRDGADSGGGGPWSTAEDIAATSRVFDKLTPGVAYRFQVDVEYADGSKGSGSASARPLAPVVTPPTIPGPVSSARRVPLVGKSGLGFNSIVFAGGDAELGVLKSFGDQRGVPLDGVLTFPGRGSWGEMASPLSKASAVLKQGLIVCYTVPHAPEPEGDQMNQKGANDDYRQKQREFGKAIADAGCNSRLFTLRVDWECNGDWYPWSANRPGGAAALSHALKVFVQNVRAGGATNVLFDLCFNKGPSQAGADFGIFPGAEFIDVIGVDQYDQWSPSTTAAQWAAEIKRTPALQTVADFAKAKGILWSQDEGGNTHPADKDHGGDNPFYWQQVLGFVRANAERCAWHCTYIHPGAPATLKHDFASNPKSFAAYKALLKP
jgi:hypothetical protein